MAKIGRYLENDFIGPLCGTIYLPNNLQYHYSLGGYGGAMFNRTIVADLEDRENVEIPICMRNMVESRAIRDNDMFVCNLLPTQLNTRTTRTAESVIRQLNTSSLQYGLKGITNHKGGPYWGTTGLMLDKDFNPLYIYVLRGRYDADYRRFTYKKGVLYVSTDVMLREDDIMYKAIKKKVIPLILEDPNKIKPVETTRGDVDDFTTEVVIRDLSHFVHKVMEPEDEDLNISLNAHLNEHIDNVLNNMGL